MRDPYPSNISGEKVQRHVFKHEINWGYVAVAIAVIVAVWFLSGSASSRSGENTQDGWVSQGGATSE